MCKMIGRMLMIAAVFLAPLLSAAQQVSSEVPMATGMRANGKIYVVVAVLVTILTGIVLYIIRLDRKITKLEKTSVTFDHL